MDELVKSLTDLVDETLAELEELKKSDRFSAAEIKIGDSDSGIAGKDKDGDGVDKAEDKDEDEDEDEDEEDKDKAEKAEGKNSEADPNAGKHKPVHEGAAKAEAVMPEGAVAEKAEGKNSEADPNAGKHKADGGAPLVKSESVDFEEKLKKSQDEVSELMKSYIDTKVDGLESKLASIAEMVKDLADSPEPARGFGYKNLQPLTKSVEDAPEPLNKAEVADKLFELKKSGATHVDSADIISVELGNSGELSRIVEKYGLK